MRPLSLFGLMTIAAVASAQSPPRLVLSAPLRLDANELDFSALGAVKVNERGDMALTFQQDAQVQLFDGSGRRIATVGRRGSGPGEFRAPQVQGWRADTLWIFDHDVQRHTFVTRTGTLVRTQPLDRTLIPNSASIASGSRLVGIFAPHALAHDGSMLGLAAVRTANGGAAPRQAVVYAARTGEPRVVMESPRADARWDERLTFRPRMVFEPDASAVVVLDVPQLALSGASFSIVRIGVRGDTIFAKNIPYTGVAFSRAQLDSVGAGPGVVGPRPTGDGPIPRTPVAANRVPPVAPPVQSLGVGSDGLLWVTLRARDGRAESLIVNRRGDVIGTVTLPVAQSIAALDRANIWVRERDGDGLTSLVRYHHAGLNCTNSGC